MPLLLRVAHVDEVPSGTSREVKVRDTRVRVLHLGDAWYAFDGAKAKMGPTAGPPDLAWARQNGALEFRTIVRGTYVYVAVERDRQSAPAQLELDPRQPEPLPAT